MIEQRTGDWIAQRLGLATASRADKLMTPTGKASTQWTDYAAVLAGELYAGRPLEQPVSTYAMQRGTELEPVARAAYAWQNDADVQLSGFVLAAGSEDYGCSPDGLIGTDGLVEIKCQMDTGHAATLGTFAATGQPPPAHFAQAHFQMLVTDRAYCDLYYWHPDLPAVQHRIERRASTDTLLRVQIENVIERRNATLAFMYDLDQPSTI